MGLVHLGVYEVDTRTVCVHPEQNKLEVILAEGERLECFPIGYGHGTIAEFNGGGGVHRVPAHRVGQFGDVVDAIAVDIGRVGHEELLHPVALRRQCRHVLGQRGRTRLTQLHQDRELYLSAIHIVLLARACRSAGGYCSPPDRTRFGSSSADRKWRRSTPPTRQAAHSPASPEGG